VNLILWSGNEGGLRENDRTHTHKDIIATLGIITNTPPPWRGVYHDRIEKDGGRTSEVRAAEPLPALPEEQRDESHQSGA
jgi:hypothetical protein